MWAARVRRRAPALAAALAIAAAWLTAGLLDDGLARLLLGAAVALPAYLLSSLVCNRPWLAAMLDLPVVELT